ncbi:N-acetylmuramoyl-L-alanine amidase [Paenibacillus sp. PAMC21692]|uniref:N-acetylmuramoyl-L-alanine amidase n=1 Tax=Paenibacillus sp. PAMC21692 TaxID=2762320 RepID=UPI00164EC4F2|nr:N-acetylmuramoyl-L-alanine amidase [Paenibacillus sp. PAMC21692]QNK54581.1 N-acetylmuramoyl-L-alanine amidase [Paenibacillus sp. PAMC21692]
MSLTVTKIRVYVSGGKVYRCDGNYTKKATDVRYVVITAAEYDIKAVARTGAKPTVLARENNAELAINFPYYNDADRALLGTAIVNWTKGATPLAYETSKTRGRAELYREPSGKYGIATSPPAIVDFAVQGSPELLRAGAVVVAESHKRDQLSISLTDRSQRTAVGIRANGDVVFVVSDGRTSYDIGLTFEELALVFRDQLGCINAINGDGGGSSILYVKSAGGAVNQASNRNAERGTGCALVVTKKAVVVPPKPDAGLNVDIDAGHGPNTAGKRCPDDSMREFAFNSVVARYVADELAGYTTDTGKPVSTRFVHAADGSRDVPLSERVAFANGKPADTYVSIHANAFGSGWNDANGIETYAATVASATSVKLAQAVQKALISATGRRNRGMKRADFTVISKTTMPAILVEAGFMSNREEATLLKSDSYRRKVAAAIVAGLVDVYGLRQKIVAEPEKPTKTTKDVTITSVNVEVNGTRVLDGHIIEGTSYVPARAVAESLGGAVTWDEVAWTVKVTR